MRNKTIPSIIERVLEEFDRIPLSHGSFSDKIMRRHDINVTKDYIKPALITAIEEVGNELIGEDEFVESDYGEGKNSLRAEQRKKLSQLLGK